MNRFSKLLQGTNCNQWPHRFFSGRRGKAFTLLELLVATTLLTAILGLIVAALNSSLKIWRHANARIDSFQVARATFDIVTKRLGQATLNTYWDYYDTTGTPFRRTASPSSFVPARYGRYSDLHFICGPSISENITTPAAWFGPLPTHTTALTSHAAFFVVPSGVTANKSYQPMPELLTACGFFVAFGSDESTRPRIISTPGTYRWRLMELNAPTESLEVFSATGTNSWYVNPLAAGQAWPIADNIIALVIWPRLSMEDEPSGTSIAPNYSYDSRTAAAWSGTPPSQPVQAHQLPPMVQVTMVAIDEASAKRLENGSTPPAQITAALTDSSGVPLFAGPVTSFEADLEKLKSNLISLHINYRVFTSFVALRESRWSP